MLSASLVNVEKGQITIGLDGLTRVLTTFEQVDALQPTLLRPRLQLQHQVGDLQGILVVSFGLQQVAEMQVGGHRILQASAHRISVRQATAGTAVFRILTQALFQTRQGVFPVANHRAILTFSPV